MSDTKFKALCAYVESLPFCPNGIVYDARAEVFDQLFGAYHDAYEDAEGPHFDDVDDDWDASYAKQYADKIRGLR